MKSKPNILLIISDQLSWRALSAYGGSVKTPNLDRIVTRGVRFGKAYCAFPLCQPSRASFWTGLFPHQTGVESNGRKHFVPTLSDEIPTLGALFSSAGYQAIHFGKTHDAGSLRGFEIVPVEEQAVEGTEAWPVNYDTRRDRDTTVKIVSYLEQRGDDTPFFAVADLQNPHDICSWIGHNQGAHEDVPVDGPLPELPDNFATEDFEDRPLPVQYICCSHNRQSQAAEWTETNYRHYLAAYYHYIQRMDAELGLILDALEARSDADDTLIVFMADHGDGMASHGHVTKQVNFYEEITRIPFIFAGPGVKPKGSLLADPLVSLMDLLPTLCDYVGIAPPEGLWGRSLMPWLQGIGQGSPHQYVACEWHTEWGFTIEPGRMIRTADFKYTRYLEGDGEELYDLHTDPGETRNLAGDPEYAEALNTHRRLLADHLKATRDPFLELEYEVAPRWRSHKPGYHNHRGPAAPMVE